MSKHKKTDGSWYDLKWKNKRALKNRERKRILRESKTARSEESGVWPASAWIVEISGADCEVMRAEQHLSCTIAGELSTTGDQALAIGDRVGVDEERLLVATRFPRHSKLVRMREDRSRRSPCSGEEQVLAANVDVACIVASTADPPFHPRLIDRYLVMCENEGSRPLICINKCDLAAWLDLDMYKTIGIPIVFVSATTGEGMDDLREHLRNSWSVLVGHSGVGKSSLINKLIGSEAIKTANVGERSKRGRHTTTASSVYELGENTFIIDTPGIRSWGLWSIDRNALKDYFPEFISYSVNCRYRDCTHTVEPDCAVLDEVTAEEIPKARYESYRRMLESLNQA